MTESTEISKEILPPQERSPPSNHSSAASLSELGAKYIGERLPNLPISAELIMKVIEACALSDLPLGTERLREYTGTTMRTIKEVIKGSLWLGVIDQVGQEYVASRSIKSEFPMGDQGEMLLFLQHLQRKKSFVQFSTFLDYSDDPLVAATKVRVLYRIDITAETIVQVFGGWGRSAGVLVGKNQSLKLKPEYHAADLPTEYIEGLRDALQSDMKARVFINRKLKEGTFHAIPDAGLERAVRAIRGPDPRNAVEDAGELLEDFLRIKAERDGVDVKGANGIGGVLDLLEKNYPKLAAPDSKPLTNEHNKIGEALNTLRVMSTHPTRAASGLRWEIRPDSGLEVVLLILTLIRSIDEYDRTKAAVF